MKKIIFAIILGLSAITLLSPSVSAKQASSPKQNVQATDQKKETKTNKQEERDSVNLLEVNGEKKSGDIEVKALSLKEKVLAALREAHAQGKDLDIEEAYIERLTDEQIEALVGNNYSEATNDIAIEFAKEDVAQASVDNDEEGQENDEEISDGSVIDRIKYHKGKLAAVGAFMATAGLATKFPRRGESSEMDEIMERATSCIDIRNISKEDFSTDKKAVKKLNDIMAEIQKAEGFNAEDFGGKINLAVVKGDEINAMACENGTIIATEGLSKLPKAEAASVLRHEMGHVINKDSEKGVRADLMDKYSESKDFVPLSKQMLEYNADAKAFYLGAGTSNIGGQLASFYNQDMINSEAKGMQELRAGETSDHPSLESRREAARKRLEGYSNNRVQVREISETESRVTKDGKTVFQGNHEQAALKAGEYAQECHNEVA